MTIMLPRNILMKYPFLSQVKDLVGSIEIVDIFRNNRPLVENARVIIEESLKHYQTSRILQKVSEDNLFLIPTLKMIIWLLQDRFVINHVANLISKSFSELLSREEDQLLIQIARDQDFVIENYSKETLPGRSLNEPFQVHFYNYLHVTSVMHDPAFKLINQDLLGGIVYLSKHQVIRIIEEIIKRNILNVNEIDDPGKLREKWLGERAIYQYIESLSELNKPYLEEHKKHGLDFSKGSIAGGPLDPESLPPCVKTILKRIEAGANLHHPERLFITSFLLNIQDSKEHILSLFSRSPDFDLKKTEYQIDHLAGKGGKGVLYKPYGCDKLDSLRLCPEKCQLPYQFNSVLVCYNYNVLQKRNEHAEKSENDKKE